MSTSGQLGIRMGQKFINDRKSTHTQSKLAKKSSLPGAPLCQEERKMRNRNS